MRSRLAVMVVVMISTVSAFGHGGAEHVMGTVVATSPTMIQVKTVDGTVKQVVYDQRTAFSKAGGKADAADLKVGDRVVIDVRKVNGALLANEVKIGTNAKKKVAKSNLQDQSEQNYRR